MSNQRKQAEVYVLLLGKLEFLDADSNLYKSCAKMDAETVLEVNRNVGLEINTQKMFHYVHVLPAECKTKL